VKIKTAEASKRLGIHPSQLLFKLANLDASLKFNDVWPEMDEGWFQTLSVQMGLYPPHKTEKPITEPGPRTEGLAKGLSSNTLHVVDKLRRQKKWGHMSVTFEALVNLTHLSNKELHQALAELRLNDFLDHTFDIKGTISLNPAKTRDIESL
jgi:hypothetical protein